MPPRPPLPNSVKIEVNWQAQQGMKATNIMYALASGSTSNATTLAAFAADVYKGLTVANGTNVPLISNIAGVWNLVSTIAIDNSGATDEYGAHLLSTPGALGSPALSPQVAACWSWTINRRHRGGHPRTYLAGLTTVITTSVGSNMISSTWQNNLVINAQNFMLTINASVAGSLTWQLGTISYYNNHLALDPPVFYPYLGVEVGARLDTQRRRLGKEPQLVP